MIIHKRPSVMRRPMPRGTGLKYDFEKDRFAGRTSCSKKITPEWMKEGEGNMVADPGVFGFELWRQENGTLCFTREVCEDCILRDSLVDLGSVELEGTEATNTTQRQGYNARVA